MRIQSIHADNFKSLVDFEIQLPKFVCLIGLNGAGKSTILQLLDFLSQQMRGDLKGWLDARGWRSSDLTSRFSAKKNIYFDVALVSGDDTSAYFWAANFNTSSLRCSTEHLWGPPGESLLVRGNRLGIEAPPDNRVSVQDIAFEYEGSVLSQVRSDRLPDAVKRVKAFFAATKSLDLLAPQYLRQRTRQSDGSLGLGGQQLSAFVYEMGPEGRRKLTESLKKVYEHLESIDASALQYGWKQLKVAEKYNGKRLVTDARHVSDGMLRLIAILAEVYSDHPLLLFDEIENGINPELVEFVINSLVNAHQQVIVTTHSPLILNYLDDEVARESVIYVYRRPDGLTRCIPFFSIPSLSEKLKVMGPGEAFADTNLLELEEEILRMETA